MLHLAAIPPRYAAPDISAARYVARATQEGPAMTPQERQLVDELFDRLAALGECPARSAMPSARSPRASRARRTRVYALVQTALVQDEALKRANARIAELRRPRRRASRRARAASSTTCASALLGTRRAARLGAARASAPPPPRRLCGRAGLCGAPAGPAAQPVNPPTVNPPWRRRSAAARSSAPRQRRRPA